MNMIGTEVTHVKYGSGIIVEVSEDKMQVDFDGECRKFQYPDSVEKFFVILDEKVDSHIRKQLEEINLAKIREQEKREMEEARKKYIRKLKIKPNSQAVFELDETNIKDFLESWNISTGVYASGSKKGQPRIPRRLNLNSSCLLTLKPEAGQEEKRSIAGIFMVQEDFIGSYCETGIIKAHEKYRLLWNPEEEELLFWDYFPKEGKTVKWGGSELKYLPNTVIKEILLDMLKLTQDTGRKEEISEFYEYFREMNQM